VQPFKINSSGYVELVKGGEDRPVTVAEPFGNPGNVGSADTQG